MNKLIAVALVGALALAAPTIGAAQDYPSVDIGRDARIHIIPVTRVGGVVDTPRAAALVGGPVTLVSWKGQDNDGLDRALEVRDLDRFDVKAVYADENGAYWVFVDRRDKRPGFGFRLIF